jgi:hypothetical protein
MTSQYGAYALRAGLARLYARIRMHKPRRSDTHMHAHTRKHAHTDQYVILIAFPQQNDLVNAPQYYVIRTLPMLFFIVSVRVRSVFLRWPDPPQGVIPRLLY